jgi:hypothetical protein
MHRRGSEGETGKWSGYYILSQKCDIVLVNILTTATKQIVFSKTVGARTASVTSS